MPRLRIAFALALLLTAASCTTVYQYRKARLVIRNQSHAPVFDVYVEFKGRDRHLGRIGHDEDRRVDYRPALEEKVRLTWTDADGSVHVWEGGELRDYVVQMEYTIRPGGRVDEVWVERDLAD